MCCSLITKKSLPYTYWKQPEPPRLHSFSPAIAAQSVPVGGCALKQSPTDTPSTQPDIGAINIYRLAPENNSGDAFHPTRHAVAVQSVSVGVIT